VANWVEPFVITADRHKVYPRAKFPLAVRTVTMKLNYSTVTDTVVECWIAPDMAVTVTA
jgi:hypothetical protein